MKMRLDRALLRSGYIASAAISGVMFISGFGGAASLVTLLALILLSRISIYLYFERFLAFNTFSDFRADRVLHECIACGASCHLKVNLGKDDVERIVDYANARGIRESIVEKSGSRYWLARRSGGACVFLTTEETTPRCSIYSIRPLACRLYPLIPTGNRLRVDPLCPGLSKTKGHNFKEHLNSQEVGSHVRKVMGKI